MRRSSAPLVVLKRSLPPAAPSSLRTRSRKVPRQAPPPAPALSATSSQVLRPVRPAWDSRAASGTPSLAPAAPRREGMGRKGVTPAALAPSAPQPASAPWRLAAARNAETRRLARGVKRKAAAGPTTPGFFLREQSVRTQTTRDKYGRLLDEFKTWLGIEGWEDLPLDELDGLLCEWMDEEYFEGNDAWKGGHLMAALQWISPHWKGPGALFRSHQALKGWRNKTPSRSRLPLPQEVVSLLIVGLKVRGHVLMATAIGLMMVCYLRPSEAFKLRVRDVIPPLVGATAAHSRWSITLHASDGDAGPSKTNEYDESLLLDLDRYDFMHAPLGAATRGRSVVEALFPFSLVELRKEWIATARWLQLPTVPALYQVRHSAASAEFNSGERSLAEIQRRGRWRATSSVRRYEKGGRVTEQLLLLPLAVRQSALSCHRVLRGVLAGSLRPPRLHTC